MFVYFWSQILPEHKKCPHYTITRRKGKQNLSRLRSALEGLKSDVKMILK